MSNRDDISQLYDGSRFLGGVELVLFAFNLGSAVISVIVPVFSWKLSMVDSVLIVLQILTAFLYFVITIIDEGFFWYDAEKARRKNAIENGFGVRLSEYETDEYYNNGLNPSMEKYALNILESNFCSLFISGRMILGSCVKSIIAIIAFILVCSYSRHPGILLVLSQSLFSVYVLRETVWLLIYYFRMKKLYSDGYAIMISPGVKKRNKNASLLAYAMEYEAIKAHYRIRLKERIFEKHKASLAMKWKQIVSHKE